jgi:hypothetical protein
MMPPKPGPPPRVVPRRRILARRLGAVGAVVLAGIVVFAIVKVAGRGGGPAATAPTTAAAPKPFRVVFPEGFTRDEMAQRVQVVARIAHRERGVDPLLSRKTYLAATGPRVVPGFGRKPRRIEGFLFPATYDFLTHTTSKQLVRAQLVAFQRNWSQVNLSYARSKNLTPYDVLIIASLVEKEALAPDERPKIARVIYNRLHAHMNLGIDATTRYGLHVPATKSLTQSELNSSNPYNTRNPGSSDCRRRRSRIPGSPRCRPLRIRRRATGSISYASPTGSTTTSRRASTTSSPTSACTGTSDP